MIDFKEQMQKEFGKLNSRQLWILTLFAKNIRLRCRNNSAFNNFMNKTFPYAHFRQVEKTRKDGTKYPGLRIEVDGEEFVEQAAPEEDNE
jgi:hypothetical protein